MSGNLALKRFIVVATLAVAAAVFSRAGMAEGEIVVDTDFVEAAIDRGALIWDVRSQNAYLRGHIPGAVNIDSVTDVLRDGRTEDYIAIGEIERMLGEAGIDGNREIVLYGDKGRPPAYFGYITMRYLGVDNVTVYHGGIDDWKAGGNPVATDLVKLPPVTFKAAPDPGQLITTDEVITSLACIALLSRFS